MDTFKFVRLAPEQQTEAARMHDRIAGAFEEALKDMQPTPETVRNVVGGSAALLVHLCIEVGIDPRTVFSVQLVNAVAGSQSARK